MAAGAASVVLAIVYLRLAARSGRAGGGLIGLTFGGFLVAIALGWSSAQPAVGHLPASFDIASVSASISPIRTGWGVHQPIVISFSAPMAAASVESSLRITPQAQVRLEWDATGMQLHVVPVGAWSAGTVYTVFVGPGARSLAGAALDSMPPAIIYVRAAAVATLAPTDPVGKRIALASGFRLSFSRPVDLVSVRQAFTVTPAVPGTFSVEGRRTSEQAIVWRPDAPLAPDTRYTVTLGPSAVDLDGVPLAVTPDLAVRTLTRPAVVRFRPRNKETGIDPNQVLSVRFSQPMDHASAKAAYHLLLAGKDGARTEVDLSTAKSWWAEGDTVFVVDLPKALAYGKTYIAEVLPGAKSRLGVAISDDPAQIATGTFKVQARPATTKPATTTSTTSSGGGTSTGGGTTSTSTAPWLAVEKYYLKLLNCDHTGGWVHSDGSCTGYGSNGNAPFKLDSYLSDCASRPWAKYLAQTDQLYHGDVGGRFAACGYNVNWGENITWHTGDAYGGAISSMLFFQSEKSYNGGHWVNLMNSRFTHVGIGVWGLNGKYWYVVDFWGPY